MYKVLQRGAGRSTRTVYNMLSLILKSKFNLKFCYVTHNRDYSLIKEVWLRSFSHHAPLGKFLNCITIRDIGKKSY